jgi:hypothetical protein
MFSSIFVWLHLRNGVFSCIRVLLHLCILCMLVYLSISVFVHRALVSLCFGVLFVAFVRTSTGVRWSTLVCLVCWFCFVDLHV